MTPTELSIAEKTERLARLMGWFQEDCDNSCGDTDCCGGYYPNIQWCKQEPNELGGYDTVAIMPVDEFNPCKSYDDAHIVLDWVKADGKLIHVIDELSLTCWKETGFDPNSWRSNYKIAWLIATATPAQLMDAVLAVYEGAV
jgi:hypothetical protein